MVSHRQGAVIVPIGDGRVVEMEEGALRVPPPVPDKPKAPKKSRVTKRKIVRSQNYYVVKNGKKYLRKQRPEGYVKKVSGVAADASLRTVTDIPGGSEWRSLRTAQVAPLSPGAGRKLGQADGMTLAQSDAEWTKARRMARKDMDTIKKVMPDLPDAAAEALQSTLEVMRSPMSQQVKLAAAKQVLDFTMAKPVAKSEVTVNAAEKWLEELGKDG